MLFGRESRGWGNETDTSSSSGQILHLDIAGAVMAFNQETADAIVELLQTMPLKEICARDGMPSRSEVYRWMDANPEFGTQCAHARAIQVDALVDDMADIEDRVLTGEIDPAAARVVLDSQRWRAIKVAPQKYGDKSSIEYNGSIRVDSVEWVILETQPKLPASI